MIVCPCMLTRSVMRVGYKTKIRRTPLVVKLALMAVLNRQILHAHGKICAPNCISTTRANIVRLVCVTLFLLNGCWLVCCCFQWWFNERQPRAPMAQVIAGPHVACTMSPVWFAREISSECAVLGSILCLPQTRLRLVDFIGAPTPIAQHQAALRVFEQQQRAYPNSSSLSQSMASSFSAT
jgi:hypothetical protein